MLMTSSKASKATAFLKSIAKTTGGNFYDLKTFRNFNNKK